MALAEAIKSRWTAAGLASSVGRIHHSRAPEKSDMPYAVYNEISNSETGQTHCLKMLRSEIQIDVYTKDGDAGACRAKADLIIDALEYSSDAASSPLTVSGWGITDIVATGDPVTTAEGDDEVYRSRVGFVVRYSKSVDRTP